MLAAVGAQMRALRNGAKKREKKTDAVGPKLGKGKTFLVPHAGRLEPCTESVLPILT